MRVASLAILVLLAAPMAVAQVETSWYLSAQPSASFPGAEQLVAEVPGTDGNKMFSPLLPGVAVLPGNSYRWVADDPFVADQLIAGDAAVTLYFANGVDVQATTTVVLELLDAAGGVTEVSRDSSTGLAEIAPHTETFTLATNGATIPAGFRLSLTVTMTDLAVLTQVDYGTTQEASRISGIALAPAQGGTPTNPAGPGAEGADTTADDDDPEVWVASILFTISLAAAGIARLSRFPA